MNQKILALTIATSLLALTACVPKGTSSSSLSPTVQTVADTSVIDKSSVLAMPILK